MPNSGRTLRDQPSARALRGLKINLCNYRPPGAKPGVNPMQATASPALHRTPSRVFGPPAAAAPSTALTPPGTPERKPDPTPERGLALPPPALRERRARHSRDGAIELLWALVFAVGVQQLRQSHEFPLDRDSRAGWTWCAVDLALGIVVRSLMNAVTDRVGAWRQRPEARPEAPVPLERALSDRPLPLERVRRRDSRAVAISFGEHAEDRPTDATGELESLLKKANAQPRKAAELREWVRQIADLQRRYPAAIGLGEATWAAARLAQRALPLPASATGPDLEAFAQAAECLLTPAKEAHRQKRITPEELQMASDHLERQVFERLRGSPWALRGAALASVRAQIGGAPDPVLERASSSPG